MFATSLPDTSEKSALAADRFVLKELHHSFAKTYQTLYCRVLVGWCDKDHAWWFLNERASGYIFDGSTHGKTSTERLVADNNLELWIKMVSVRYSYESITAWRGKEDTFLVSSKLRWTIKSRWLLFCCSIRTLSKRIVFKILGSCHRSTAWLVLL